MSKTLIGVAPAAPGSVTPDGRICWSPQSEAPKSGVRAIIPARRVLELIDEADYDAEHARLCGDSARATIKSREAFALRRALFRAEKAGFYSLVGDLVP